MPTIRKCSACKEPSLISNVGIFKATRLYECSNCGEIVKLMPLAMLGMQLTVFIFLSLASLSWVIFFANQGAKLATLIYIYGFWLLMTVSVFSVIYFKIKKHKENPIINDATNANISKINNRISQADSWIESKNFLFGMLAPIFFILIILIIFALLVFIDSIFF